MSLVLAPPSAIYLRANQLIMPFVFFDTDDPKWHAQVLNPPEEMSRLLQELSPRQLSAETAYSTPVAFRLL